MDDLGYLVVVERSFAPSVSQNRRGGYSLPGQASSAATCSFSGTVGLVAWITDENNPL